MDFGSTENAIFAKVGEHQGNLQDLVEGTAEGNWTLGDGFRAAKEAYLMGLAIYNALEALKGKFGSIKSFCSGGKLLANNIADEVNNIKNKMDELT
jgi:hypothetical protein